MQTLSTNRNINEKLTFLNESLLYYGLNEDDKEVFVFKCLDIMRQQSKSNILNIYI